MTTTTLRKIDCLHAPGFGFVTPVSPADLAPGDRLLASPGIVEIVETVRKVRGGGTRIAIRVLHVPGLCDGGLRTATYGARETFARLTDEPTGVVA